MQAAKSKKRARGERLSRVNPNAAGIDVGSRFHVVAIPHDRDEEPVRTFQSFTEDIYCLADWLVACGTNAVAMESTGIYWVALYEALEARGIAVLVANAREVKHVPGRKSDVNDAQWLQQLHEYGLLPGSFHPCADIAALRAYMRQRERPLHHAASPIQHMQKALTQMNLQLHLVVADITGKTGMQIIRAIVAGERDAAVLATFRDPRCRASVETITQALVGHYRPEHLFAVSQALAQYDTYQRHVAECDRAIENLLQRLHSAEGPAAPLPAPRTETRQPNELNFGLMGRIL